MLDPALMEAIAQVVSDAGQPKPVAQRLTAWLLNLSQADPGLDQNTQFLKNVHDALDLGDGDAD